MNRKRNSDGFSRDGWLNRIQKEEDSEGRNEIVKRTVREANVLCICKERKRGRYIDGSLDTD